MFDKYKTVADEGEYLSEPDYKKGTFFFHFQIILKNCWACRDLSVPIDTFGFSRLDKDKSGTIDFGEFLKVLLHAKKVNSPSHAAKVSTPEMERKATDPIWSFRKTTSKGSIENLFWALIMWSSSCLLTLISFPFIRVEVSQYLIWCYTGITLLIVVYYHYQVGKKLYLFC